MIILLLSLLSSVILSLPLSLLSLSLLSSSSLLSPPSAIKVKSEGVAIRLLKTAGTILRVVIYNIINKLKENEDNENTYIGFY